jgi:signal transduction histidine kinase
MRRRNSNNTNTASLRWRLTLVNLAMLVMTLVALDSAIYMGLHWRYYSDLQSKLNGAVSHARAFTPVARESPEAVASALSSSSVVAVVSRPGHYPIVGKARGFEALTLPAIAGPPANTDESFGLFVAAVSSDSHLIWKLETLPPSTDSVLFAISTKPVENTLRRLLIAELVGTLLVLGLAALYVRVVVRLTLRPLDRIARTASRISAGDLDQRLRPSKPWTELGKLATSLDAMVDSLASSLVSERMAHEQASSSEERMRDFLSDASHELRTPIAGLQWSAEALLRHGHQRKRREQLAFEIARQAHRASQLVSDLLSMARLDQGLELERKPFDLTELAAEEIERVRRQEPGLELRLVIENGCPIVADEDRIRQVIANLVDTARKAMDGKGEIDLSIRRNGALVELEVRDSGPGVPEGEREHVFERFVRLDDARHGSEYGYGSGLGLAIARGIAEAHGGKLVCAESDAGARFVLELPLSGRARRHAPTRAARAS